MLNKENYVPWSSRVFRYAKSRPNGKLIYNSIMNGPYVRRMILKPGDPARTVPTMKGSDIGIQEKKAKLFNEWERFTSTDGESIESYYHHFLKLMNDFKRNKHFLEMIASNLKFLNNLQPEWSRHVTIVHQTKDLHTADYTQLYDFLKYNQKEVDELRAERLAKTQDPLALMANSNNSFKYPVFHPDLPSSSTNIQQPLPNNNNYIPQPSFNQNYMQLPMPNLKDITDPTAAINMALALMVKAFKLKYSTPTNNNKRISSNPRKRQITQPGNQVVQNPGVRNVGNQNGIRCYNCRGLGHLTRNFTVRPRRRDAAYLLVEQDGGTVDQHPATVEETRAYFESLYNNLALERGLRTLIDMEHKDRTVFKPQLGDQKGKSQDTPCVSNTLDPLSQKLENENVELEFQVRNYEKEIAHLKTTYKNLFDSISVTRAQTKTIIDSLQKQITRNTIYEMVIQICLWCVDSGCSKHMTGNLKLLINFVWKFLGTVRFGNDHVAAILGFGDLQWGNILITRVYFVEGLGHNLFLVGQFCDSGFEVAFRRNTCFACQNSRRVDF
ncbi:hypothetical protein Tco_1110233 [Tanacetum coccineum]|uniref:Retrovirus-related Pol polyprotein from transposon TNT 1-94-like beta-barrel domain-containing protein n=1 Tax=Tanacetum coccineum TaxID=301880 RepID=A0ABQ5IIB2_9ASTR